MQPPRSDIDRALLMPIADGQESAFIALVHTYGPQIYPYLVKFTGSAETAEDLSQEIFLKVWIHRDTLPEIEDLKAWLFSIAANTARSWLRKKIRDRNFIRTIDEKAQETAAHEVLDFHETEKLLQDAINSLPQRRRQIYQMQRIEGMSIAEIANRLHLSVNTVKNTLAASLNSIRGYLEQFGALSVFISLLW